jgi:serine/threonine protein kinase
MKYSAVDQNNQIEKFELSKDEKIGEGATALVYKVNYKNQTWAAKIFKDGQKINSAKIKTMLEHQPDNLLINLDGEDFIQYAWVKYIIKNGVGKVVGFIMPYVAHDDTYSLDTFYDPVLSKRLKPYESALSLRIQLAINLCELIESLHKKNNYFIDIKPQNIRVYKINHRVVLLDCDGYSINNPDGLPKRFDAELVSLDYIAPEVKRDNLKPSELGIQQDLYGLAVILFQLLNRGTHPFQGITVDKSITAITNDERAALGLYAYGLKENWKVKPRSQSIHNLFLDETRALFDKSFETESRTTAEEWIHHFKEILNNKKLELCDKVDRSKKLEKDLIHIKFNGKECIGCKLDLEIKKSKPPKKKEYKVNYNNTNSTGPTATSASYYSNSYLPNQNKPDEFNFTKFFFWTFIILVAIFFISLLGNSSNNSPTSNSSIQVSPTQVQINESCNIDLKYSTPKQLCESYWSKTVKYTHTCNIAISKELNNRGLYSFPEEKCGLKTIDSSLPNDGATGNKSKNPQSVSSQNLSDKVTKLATDYGSNTLSFDLVRNNPENFNIYNLIVQDIVNKFKVSDKNKELIDGLIIHKQINLPYISKVVWYAAESESCSDRSLGTKEVCLLSNGNAICQPIELNLKFKSLCVESFTK